MENQTFNAVEAAKAQKEYCETRKDPHFAPMSGNCWSCRKNIYTPIEHKYKDYFTVEEKVRINGISVEKAGKELITGCPHCNRSYCD